MVHRMQQARSSWCIVSPVTSKIGLNFIGSTECFFSYRRQNGPACFRATSFSYLAIRSLWLPSSQNQTNMRYTCCVDRWISFGYLHMYLQYIKEHYVHDEKPFSIKTKVLFKSLFYQRVVVPPLLTVLTLLFLLLLTCIDYRLYLYGVATKWRDYRDAITGHSLLLRVYLLPPIL